MGVVGSKVIIMLSETRFPREVACATGAIGVALLLHELGHAAVGWLRGLGPRELTGPKSRVRSAGASR